MKRYPGASDRRGVILLVILGLVALFGMVAVSFLLVAGHHRRAAVTQARIGQVYDPPHKLLEEAMYQIIRGTDNRFSAIRHHSLLEDMYGSPEILFMAHDPRVNVQVQVLGSTTAGGDGQLLAFTAIGSFDVQNPSYQPVDKPYRFVGRVITPIEGPAAGRSARIVDYDPATNAFIAVPFEGIQNAQLVQWFQEPFVVNPGNPVPRVVRLLVNGVPFAGAGVGFNGNLSNPRCDAPYPTPESLPVSAPAPLLPNPRYWVSGTDPADPGGANEDYDAVDYQNMLLALQLPAPTGEPFGSVPVPSLHRPELLNYWVHKLVNDWLVTQQNVRPADAWRMVLRPDLYAPPNLRRPIIRLWSRANLRPLIELHQQFGTTNSALAAWASRDLSNLDEQTLQAHWLACPLLRGPWDVDNDGDGLADSIWVDLGFPVRQTPDGRFYKPLFAIHCIDLDGRLNVNAHGSLAQTMTSYYQPPQVSEAPAPGRSFADATGQPSDGIDPITYARYGGRGSGFGPAEINLLPLFDGNLAAYRELFVGRVSPPLEGR
ncbi:MAG: hypothetical protein NZ899_11635, partial [Thermoguttaceae bacterium]|nr:hypothetical protein [Thermoguttaceae bacterium]